jgi:hypothetical protein
MISRVDLEHLSSSIPWSFASYCNYILPPLPHTPGLDTRWIPHSLQHHPAT